MEAPPVSEEQLEEVLEWIDGMTFSRATRNLARDFSDGVLMAEVMKHEFPNVVQLHNYQPANSSAAKYINWKTLNEKIFKKIGFQIHRHDVESIINNTPQSIEKVLHLVYCRIVAHKSNPNQFGLTERNNIEKVSSATNRKGKSENIDYAKQLSSQLAEKEMVIKELRETIEILETKLKKMDQLNKLKDVKIDSLMKKLDESIGL